MEEIDLIKVFEKACLDKKYCKRTMLIEQVGSGYYAECIVIRNEALLLHPNGTIPTGGRLTFMQTSQEISLGEYKRLRILHDNNFYSSNEGAKMFLKQEGLID